MHIELKKSHTGKGYCIYEVDGSTHTPLVYLKKSFAITDKYFEEIINKLHH